MMKQPILITGCARSGTSLTAGIIHICGAFGGETCGPTPANKRGQFENTEVRNAVTKPYLRSIGCDEMGQRPLPSTHQVFNVTEDQGVERREKVLEIMTRQGLKQDAIWFIKEAKACLTWRLWSLAFPGAKWVIVRREPNDIARSCLQTHFMRAYRDVLGWLRWVETHEKRFAQMKTAGLDVREVWPSRIVAGDLSEIQEVVGWLGLTWQENLVRAFVSPDLWGSK
jgi:hypothetical protein